MKWLVLDLASAPIDNAESFIEPVKAPSHYRDEEKIAAYVAEKTAERAAAAALDLDLARVTCIDFVTHEPRHPLSKPLVLKDELQELHDLMWLGGMISDGGLTVVTYGGFNYDLPLLMRRARYLGVNFPKLNLDRYRSPHIDLCELLSDRNPQRRRPLSFYVRRLGWTDLLEKPMAGADEARVFETGEWDKLAASVRRDVMATYRLAQWCGVVPASVAEPQPEPVV